MFSFDVNTGRIDIAPCLPRTPVGERQPGGDGTDAGGSRETDASRRAVLLALALAGAVWAVVREPLPTLCARDAGRELMDYFLTATNARFAGAPGRSGGHDVAER